MFPALNPLSGFHLCPCPLCLEKSSPSPPRIPFEQRAGYWFCGRVAGWEWRRSPFGHDSAFYTSAIQYPHCVTTAELMSPSSPWELRNGELIGRHFIIGSWWLNRGLSFSNSPISSFVKVQNVWSVSQVWQLSLESNRCVYGTSHYRMSDLTKTRVKGCFT